MASVSVLEWCALQDVWPGESADACSFIKASRTESSLAETHGNSETSAKPNARARPITSRRLEIPRRLVETRNQVKAAIHNAIQAKFDRVAGIRVINDVASKEKTLEDRLVTLDAENKKLTALNDALRDTILGGASLASQGGRLAILALWGGISFVLALRWFRWA